MSGLLERIHAELNAVLEMGLAGAGTKDDPASFEGAVALAAEAFSAKEVIEGAKEALDRGENGLSVALAESVLEKCSDRRLVKEAKRICAAASADGYNDEINRDEPDDALLVQDVLNKTREPEGVGAVLESFLGNLLLDVWRTRKAPRGTSVVVRGYRELLEKLGLVRARRSEGKVELTARGRAVLGRLRPDLRQFLAE